MNEDSVPLLDQTESSIHEDRVLFSVEDDDDDDTPLAQSHLINHVSQSISRSPLHDESLPSYEYPVAHTLKSTIQSREDGTRSSRISSAQHQSCTEFDLDTDEIDGLHMTISDPARDVQMPLLVGLMESSRRSTDIPLHVVNGNADTEEENEIAQLKTRKNGGMLESIANMANAILGAGMPFLRPRSNLHSYKYRNHW